MSTAPHHVPPHEFPPHQASPQQAPQHHVPPPPPGPGVHPPFPAPPVEGRGRRIGLGLGIGAGVLVLVCGGGAAALAGLTTAMDDALNEQAHVVVGRYVDAVRDRDFARAYDQLCAQARNAESESAYTARLAATEAFSSYQIGELDFTYASVPVQLIYPDGRAVTVEAELDQNTSTGAFEVCELGE
ncbi:hypothetical protein [Actinoplanes sp. DH11]|uniref:hypothetical protein n=1 Tax=Actinoplanes sp. DH11 TaxID=2857011 RepID=UPI001E42E7C0|nr:hypothetical protein [Actinoplanes sp. DH11]